MCGRLACTLAPDSICKACSFKDFKSQNYYVPEWVNSNERWTYQPSHNVAPTDVTPVLASGKHFPGIASSDKPVVHPMIWGMIPPWHTGSYNNHKMSTNNCRLENVQESRLYSAPLKKGHRCVIVCDGFYEWQTTKGSQKKPYFIYAPQVDGVLIENKGTWNESWTEEIGWQGPKLLKLAGLFDSWTSGEGEQLYSYTVVTMESNETLSWLHHRMPAVLDSEEDVVAWLDHGKVPFQAALNLLKPVKSLSWHEVGMLVNNSRNKDPQCNKPVSSKPKSASSLLMESWLKKSAVKKETVSDSNSSSEPTPSKRSKQEGPEDGK